MEGFVTRVMMSSTFMRLSTIAREDSVCADVASMPNTRLQAAQREELFRNDSCLFERLVSHGLKQQGSCC